jgi:hypothetical protein
VTPLLGGDVAMILPPEDRRGASAIMHMSALT